MKKRKWLGVFFFFLLLFSGAATANAYERATFKDFVAGADADNAQLGASVECAATGRSMDISFQTMELSEDTYSTVTAYRSESRSMDLEGSVMVGIANMQNQTARMNFSIIDQSGSAFQVKEGCYVALRDDQTTYVPVEKGCFEIPAGFSGELEIPFPVLSNDAAKEALSQKITGYGFVCVAAGQSRYHLKFYDMNFLDSSEAVNAHEAAILKINGDATVRKPETGRKHLLLRTLLTVFLVLSRRKRNPEQKKRLLKKEQSRLQVKRRINPSARRIWMQPLKKQSRTGKLRQKKQRDRPS